MKVEDTLQIKKVETNAWWRTNMWKDKIPTKWVMAQLPPMNYYGQSSTYVSDSYIVSFIKNTDNIDGS